MVQEASDEEEPTDTDKLILNSLPSSQRRTVSLAEIRRLTRSEGSWEAATELLIDKFNASEQERVKSLQAQLEAEKLAAEVSSPEAAVEEAPPEKVILRLRGRPRKNPAVSSLPDPSKSVPNLPSTSSQALTIPAIDSLRGHRARSLSLSDESSESPRQRSRRDSPISAASFGSASSTEASSVSNEDFTPTSTIPDRSATTNQDSAVATRLRNSTLPKVEVEPPLPPPQDSTEVVAEEGSPRETRSGAATVIPKRGPTSREKKDIQRKKKLEAKVVKGKKKVANKLLRKRLPGELLNTEIVITTRVKELYI